MGTAITTVCDKDWTLTSSSFHSNKRLHRYGIPALSLQVSAHKTRKLHSYAINIIIFRAFDHLYQKLALLFSIFYFVHFLVCVCVCV